jgi:hypothetical protein
LLVSFDDLFEPILSLDNNKRNKNAGLEVEFERDLDCEIFLIEYISKSSSKHKPKVQVYSISIGAKPCYLLVSIMDGLC